MSKKENHPIEFSDECPSKQEGVEKTCKEAADGLSKGIDESVEFLVSTYIALSHGVDYKTCRL